MYSKEKSKKNTVIERNVIAKNTKIKGNIVSDGDFRVDGTLEGVLQTDGKIIIGVEGFINGKVEAENAEVEGKFTGEILIKGTLTVKSSANISGDVIIEKLSVEPGASFNASCSMKGDVKELNQKQDSVKIEEQTA